MKALLRQAGGLKRRQSNQTEYTILKNALKNYNLPRVVTDDKPIFENLCEDLFPEIPLIYEPDKELINAAKYVIQDKE